jgi:hypothetical protein
MLPAQPHNPPPLLMQQDWPRRLLAAAAGAATPQVCPPNAAINSAHENSVSVCAALHGCQWRGTISAAASIAQAGAGQGADPVQRASSQPAVAKYTGLCQRDADN